MENPQKELQSKGMIFQPDYKIYGKVEPGFEPVLKEFESMFDQGLDKNSQLCVYYKDKCVIDIWGVTPDKKDKQQYSPDSLLLIMSAGKSVPPILLGILKDQGLLDFDEKVATYWPEFAQNGKENITVADVLRHDAGLQGLSEPFEFSRASTENIKKNKIGEMIEKETTHFLPHNQTRCYHSITKDLITNEIFRRVEPQGRTMGEYMQQVLIPEHGFDIHIRMDKETLNQVYDFKKITGWPVFKNMMKSGEGGRYACISPIQLPGFIKNMKKTMAAYSESAPSENRKTMSNNYLPKGGMELFYMDDARTSEIPSDTTHASARGLAKMAAFMANKGKLGDKQLLSEETWNDMHSGLKGENTAPFCIRTNFTKGGFNLFDQDLINEVPKNEYYNDFAIFDQMEMQCNHWRKGYYGWFGYGGALMQWQPTHNIGFGYVPSDFFLQDFLNNRGARLQHKVLECVQKLG